MLRHWDAAGLLVPDRVDPFTGYRSYDPSQLEGLHRIVALSASVSEQPEISGVIGLMYGRIVDALTAAGAPLGPAIAEYAMSEDGMRLVAGFEASDEIPGGLEEVMLPATSRRPPRAARFICGPSRPTRPTG